MARSQQRRKRIDDLLCASVTILSQAEGPLTLAPIPGLSVAAGALLQLVEMVQRTRSNKEEFLHLAQSLKSLATFLESTTANLQSQIRCDPNAQITIASLQRSQDLLGRVKQLSEKGQEVLEGGIVARFFRSNSDAATLQSLDKDIQQAQSRFKLQGTVTIEMMVNELIATTQTTELERQLGKLHTVDAGYRAPVNARKSRWVDGTRTQLLHDIVEWSRGHGTDEARANAKIFVLTGGAGTGKSTIAVQVAKMFDEAGVLGGSFFFEHGVEEISSTRYVFPTLAVQLARLHKYLAPSIIKGIAKHQEKGNTQNLTYALDELIVEPLSEIPENQRPSRPLVFVLDALDECNEQDQVPGLLYLLLKRMRSLRFPLRLFLTSRPEYHIQDAFESVEWESEPKPFQLMSIATNIVRDDIRHFFNSRLTEVGIAEKLLTVRDDAVERLVDAAGGLFVYASTTIEFLARYKDDLGETLKLVMEYPLNDSSLDALYGIVLRKAFSENDFRHRDLGPLIPTILGTLAVLQDQLPPEPLCNLLQIRLPLLIGVLRRLQSVLIFGFNQPIRLLHASFPQYLVDPRRCHLPNISDHPSFRGNDPLAIRCLDILLDVGSLKKNICNLEDPLVFRMEIPDLNERLTRSIPPHVQYSCLYWASHLCKSTSSPELTSLLGKFTETKMLPWMEALGMLGRIDAAVSMLSRTLHWYKMDDKTRLLLNDGYRFILTFLDAIKSCPYQTYVSGLAFSPTRSLLRVVYAHHLSIVDALAGPDEGWGACLREMEHHRHDARSVMFSYNGQWIASAGVGGDVNIWDSASGLLVRTLSGHTDKVHAAVFSSDDKTIVSGSKDRSIRIWNTASGAPLKVISLDAQVMHITLLPAAPKLAQKIVVVLSTLLDPGHLRPGSKTMFLDSKSVFSTHVLDIDGHLLRTLSQGLDVIHPPRPDCSIDSKYLAVPERGGITIYNASTYSVWKELVGHESHVYDVKFLYRSESNGEPDLLVSGSLDTTIRLWQIQTQTCIHVFEGHSGSVETIAINPLKGLIASAADDKELRLWSYKEKTCVSTHWTSRSITSLSFSPNGEYLASASDSRLLHIWDTNDRSFPEVPVNWFTSPGSILPMPADWIISPDGRFMVAMVSMTEAELWSTRDGRLVTSVHIAAYSLHQDSLATPSGDDPWVVLFAAHSSAFLINIMTLETSYQRKVNPLLRNAVRRGFSSDGQLIYLLGDTFEDGARVRHWYRLDWNSQEIARVEEKDVPPESCSLRRPQHRYVEEEGWLAYQPAFFFIFLGGSVVVSTIRAFILIARRDVHLHILYRWD
ncbi:hypothetical protein ONZ45_g4686 [Pleurotus djamor]|nr:hypothetical protein ONZ45_g4686 [Pleurotus djamor]